MQPMKRRDPRFSSVPDIGIARQESFPGLYADNTKLSDKRLDEGNTQNPMAMVEKVQPKTLEKTRDVPSRQTRLHQGSNLARSKDRTIAVSSSLNGRTIYKSLQNRRVHPPRIKAPETNDIVQKAVRKHLSSTGNVKPLGEIPKRITQELFGQTTLKNLTINDPAPSRVSYRIQRLWLTPSARFFIKAMFPIAGLLGVGLFLFSNENLQDVISYRWSQARNSIKARPEFMIEALKIQDVSPSVDEKIRTISDIHFPISSFDLDLPLIRKKIESLDAVKSVSLYLRPGGILDLVIEERLAVVVWRGQNGLELLDINGVKVSDVIRRSDYSDLPLISGVTVTNDVAEALEIFGALDAFKGRVRGLVRIGDRRWDIILDRNQVIKLPDTEPIVEIERLLAWQLSAGILTRDILAVDLRNPKRPYVRLSKTAIDELRVMRAKANGKGNYE